VIKPLSQSVETCAHEPNPDVARMGRERSHRRLTRNLKGEFLAARENFLCTLPAHMNHYYQFRLGRSRIDISRNPETGTLESWHGAILQRRPELTLADIDAAISTLQAVRDELQDQ
jgi:hypothetical protein